MPAIICDLFSLRINLDTLKTKLWYILTHLKDLQIECLKKCPTATPTALKIDWQTWSCCPWNKELYGYQLPKIGYYGPGYPMDHKFIWIRMIPEQANYAPKNLKLAVCSALRIPAQTNFTEITQATKIVPHFNVAITRTNQQIYGRTCNLILHPYMRFYNKNDNYSEQMPMGLFSGNGIDFSVGDLPHEKMQELQVYYHDGAYSPNNARFTISNDRALATFWTAAITADRKHLTITYFLLINEHAVSQEIELIAKTANNFANLMELLTHYAESLPNSSDIQTLHNFVFTMKEMCHE